MVPYDITSQSELIILDYLKTSLTPLFDKAQLNVELDLDRFNKNLGLFIYTPKFDYSLVTQSNYSEIPETHLWVVFRNSKATKKEEFKRHGVYPVLKQVVQKLVLFDIAPLIVPIPDEVIELMPKKGIEIINKDTVARDIIVFDIAISYNYENETDDENEDGPDLLEIYTTFFEDNDEISEDISTPNG